MGRYLKVIGILSLVFLINVFLACSGAGGGSSPPEFVGTWKGMVPLTPPMPLTLTLTNMM